MALEKTTNSYDTTDTEVYPERIDVENINKKVYNNMFQLDANFEIFYSEVCK